MLRAQNLHKSYRKRKVVRGVTIQVEPGRVVGLLGPNGAGKTTCFYMIVGLIDNDSGVIRLNEQAIDHLPMHHRARLGIGYLPQEASVFRNLTVEQNEGTRSILIRIEDSGRGFDHKKPLQQSESEQPALAGRGIILIHDLCESLHYLGNGNIAEAIYSWETV